MSTSPCRNTPPAHAAEPPLRTPHADRLLQRTRAAHTDAGYTSWPAYADALEALVRQLCAQQGQP